MVRHTTSVHLVVHSDEPRPKYIPKHKRANVKNEKAVEESGNKEAANKNDETETAGTSDSPNDSNNANDDDQQLVIDPKTGKVRRNISRKRYECAACGLKATHKTDLVEHIKEKHPNAHIESMTNRDGSKIHLIVTMSKKPRQVKKLTITCLFCSKVFHDSWKYKVHLRSHTGVKPFRCSICGFRATSKMTVRDHIHRKHSNESDAKIIIRTVGIDGTLDEVGIPIPQREYRCEFCQQLFKDNYAMKSHRLQKHPEALAFSCSKCGHREGAKALLLIHCHQEHKDENLESLILKNGKPFKLGVYKVPTCEICGKMFGYQSQLYVHQRYHTGERNYNCDNCDFGTNSKASLENHILKVHLGLDLDKTRKGGRRKQTPEDEEENDEPDTPADTSDGEKHTCLDCGFSTKSLPGLQRHISRVHEFAKPKKSKNSKAQKKDASTDISDLLENAKEKDPQTNGETAEAAS